MKDNQRESIDAAEAGLEEVLRNFRSSVQAWSEAELVRPRAVQLPARASWRRAAAWALGCMLAAGSLSAAFYEHHAHQQLARQAARRAAWQAEVAASQEPAQTAAPTAEQAGGADEKLMAAVDQSVSQPVPSAMEPLAQLMDEDAGQ